jgi:predicted amidohydrolase YtcJ
MDRLIVNGRVLTLDDRVPGASAVWIRGARIVAVGDQAELRRQAPGTADVVDADGGLVVPAFHDAHLHLLSYARAHTRLDCGSATSIAELQRLLRQRARTLPPGGWLRASNLDESRFPDARLPDRHDLDRAARDRPIRLQHRTGHADVLNSEGLARLGLLDAAAPEIERDPRTGQATGRIFQGAALLRGRLPRPGEAELAADIRAACAALLSRGVTTVQDASETNGAAEWALFRRLQRGGDLGVRLFMMIGARHQDEVRPTIDADLRLGTGPVKIMVDEATSDPGEVRELVARARQAGRAVAVHAVGEAEVAMALHALRAGGPRRRIDRAGQRSEAGQRSRAGQTAGAPDRVEHAALVPDALLDELRAARVQVVGQPGLIYARGDRYLADHPPEQHGWLYRARSFQTAGVPYAASSDAPLTEPASGLALFALRARMTRSGAILGPDEALTATAALNCVTAGPAHAIGVAGQLGALRPGALADVAVLAPDALSADRPDHPDPRPARVTILGGDVVWRDGVCYQ